MPASNTALPTRKNIFTSSSNECASRRETNSANSAQWPGGSSELGPSAQYSAIILLRSSSVASSHDDREGLRQVARATASAAADPTGTGTRTPGEGDDVCQCGATKPGMTKPPIPSEKRSGCQRLGSLMWSGSLTGT